MLKIEKKCKPFRREYDTVFKQNPLKNKPFLQKKNYFTVKFTTLNILLTKKNQL